MSRIIKTIIVTAFIAISFGIASAATNFTVTALNQAAQPLADVTVAAINFGMNGPSTYTVVGKTIADGTVVLSLEDGRDYELYFSSHGFSPSLRDQFNNPDPAAHYHFYPSGPALEKTITLTSGLGQVGRVALEFTGATAGKVLFGGVNNSNIQEPVSFGVVTVAGDGTGILYVDNVPYADANTYNIGLYDPTLNRGVGRSVMEALSSGNSSISYIGGNKASFADSMAPTRVENTANQSSDGGSSLSVEGVVRSTEDAWVPIPHNGLNVRSCSNSFWTQVDESGRFQLYGLTPGVTYYVEAYGGCTWTQSGPGDCYQPYRSPALLANQDLCTGEAPQGANDFIYNSEGSLQYAQVKLDRVPKSTGQIRVYVKSAAGAPIPNAMVNISPDGSGWKTGCIGTAVSKPGFANMNVRTSATGYALIDGLPTGNYNLYVWTPFSSNGGNQAPLNGGADNHFDWNWDTAHCGGGTPDDTDDFRIYVDTDTPTPGKYLYVYDRNGAEIVVDSITYHLNIVANTSGEVKGTLRFPYAVDLANTPIMITLYPNCGNGGCPSGVSGNFTTVAGSGAAQTYSINVSSGFSYYMNVKSAGWGRVQRNGGDNSIFLQSTGTVVVDMEFAPAGTITGKMYKPDGTLFTPSNNQYIWINANNNSGWTGTQLQNDGTFEMTDVLAGVNTIRVEASGDTAFNYAMPSPAPSVTVVAGSTATVNLNLLNGNYVGIGFNLAWAPDKSMIISDHDSILGFKVIPLSAGSVIKGETISKMLVGGDEGYNSTFRYSPPVGAEGGPCGNNWVGGFCAKNLASPAVYDFYLVKAGDFGKSTDTEAAATNPYPHFTVITSSKNVVVDNARAIASVRPAYSMSTTSGVLVNLTPATDLSSRGNATLRGAVSAANFFRNSDFDAIGGDFDAFTKYLPVVSLYDGSGGFKGAGIVLPSPVFVAQHDAEFDLAFAQGYPAFKSLLDSAGSFGYEIRSLAPSTCFTAVITSPNYPSYQSRICTGVAGSTTTMSVNLDTAVGSGATLQGVVTDTNSVILANASIALSGEGIEPRAVVSNSSGAYKFEGLPPGTVRIKVSISGYASGEAEKDLTGSNVYARNFALSSAPGSISGTVYSQKMPFAKVQPGALIYAYNDTYNGNNPASPLPLLKTITGSDGTYTLTGLVAGDTYKVFLRVPGKYTLNQSVTSGSGLTAGVDFIMMAKPLDIEMFAKLGDNFYEFTVLNPQDFKDGSAKWSASPYNAASAQTVNLERLSSGKMRGIVPLSSLAQNITYVLRGEATSYSNKHVIRELLFGKSYKGNADQHIDDIIIGDDSDDGYGRGSNEAPMDKSGGDPSAIIVPAGAMLPISSASVPSCQFTGTDKDDASVAAKVDALGADAFAGSLYTISVSSVSLNPDKGFDVTLAYDKNTADLDDLGVARYNDSTAEWETVPAVATINPVKGTVKVKLKSLASVLAVKGNGPKPAFSTFNGKEYVVRPQASSSSSGTFAVVRPSVAGNAYAGAKLKVFNFPNPFNLNSKTTNPAQGAAAQTTLGTTIHVEVPAANGGAGHIRIYTLSGELVRDIGVTFEGGKHNYVNWDGRNKSGQEVANGVYYGIVKLSGKSPKLKDATFKMAVIK